jgi:multicomponent Na+:H+ antiporter subunit D
MADIIGSAAKADPAALVAVAALFALAFGIKSAAFPLNAWLPASYHAPPPAISALMGALLTKVGAYALLRTLLMLLPAARDTLSPILFAITISTALLGPLSAIAETNLRRAIGFLLIGGIGLMLLCLPFGEVTPVLGSLVYGFHSILTLAGLYMAAGLIERATGQTDTRQMRGLYAANSTISLLFLVLILAVSGVPPFLGFWPKLLLLQGFLGGGHWMAAAAVLLNALLTLIAGSRLWSHIFWRGTAERVQVPGMAMAATWVLTFVIVLLGLVPGMMIAAGQIAAGDMMNPARYIASVGLVP